jgi:hypothetical protein
MEKYFWIVTILVITLNVVSLILDGLFYNALKESQNDTLTEDEVNEFKAPVLAFIVMGSIGTFMNIVFIPFNLCGGNISYCREKMTWPFLMSALWAWLEDFPQLVIAIIAAFRADQLITVVLFLKAIYGLVKCFVYGMLIGFDRRDEHQYEQLHDVEKAETEGVNCRCCNKAMIIFGIILNCVCSFVLLVRVCRFL